MKKLTVNVNESYDILIEKGLIKNSAELIKDVLSGGKICLVSDSNVYPLYGEAVFAGLKDAGYDVCKYVFDAGEESKNTGVVIDLVEFMADNELTRGDGVVALGGGVCGDMAGFAAAIYLRGIKFVQIPTTLLSQVDSSVGGKTAVDLPQGKNLCGAFHQPSLVIIDPDVLDTLSPHYFADGMGEVIKYGCIKSKSLFDRLSDENAKDFIEDVIYECLDIKRKIVENDEKEHGERALLNFGHTAAHAIESDSNHKIHHGFAVALGMIYESKYALKNGHTDKETYDAIYSLLKSLKYPTHYEPKDMEKMLEAVSKDKKAGKNGISVALSGKKMQGVIINNIKPKELIDLFL